MDHPRVGILKIAQILPEFHEGGVERHVIWLSNELAASGHQVTVITAGGKLEEKLDPGVNLRKLPVHRKNPATGFYSAFNIAARAKRENWDILHAHSRVPVWIAWWASSMSGVPWVFTAHARYNLNPGLKPFPRAKGAICVSKAVEEHLRSFLPLNRAVIPNGLPPVESRWERRGGVVKRLLFVGRLTRIKGLDVLLSALDGLKDQEWELDVVGDGPQRAEFETLSERLGLSDRVRFHGFQDNPQDWMVESDLLVFPSLDEGMGLVLLQSAQVGLPVIASDLDAAREIGAKQDQLIPPGDIRAWRWVLRKILEREYTPKPLNPSIAFSIKEVAEKALVFYHNTLSTSI